MLIADSTALAELVDTLRTAGRFAIDTEFVREKTYRPRLCLVQVATAEIEAIVDPFAIGDMAPLTDLMSDPTVEKIAHAGEQDMEIFYVLAKTPPRNIFDTQIAAALAGYGQQVSYGKLVARLTGTQLLKVETFTDWARRPLTDAQLKYAIDDVRYLIPMRDRLGTELGELGRDDWLRDELLQYEQTTLYEKNNGEVYRKVKGAGRLKRPELAILRGLASWREQEAARMDWPRGHVVRDELLVELARRAPTQPDAIGSIRGIHPRLVERCGRAIVDEVKTALELPASEHPPLLENGRPEDELALVVDLLEIVVKTQAEKERIAAPYLGTRKELTQLARRFLQGGQSSDAPLPILSGWRRQLVGNALVELLEGRSTLSIDQETVRVKVSPNAPAPS